MFQLNSIPGLEEVEIQVELKPANPDELDKPLLEAKDEKEPAVSQVRLKFVQYLTWKSVH